MSQCPIPNYCLLILASNRAHWKQRTVMIDLASLEQSIFLAHWDHQFADDISELIFLNGNWCSFYEIILYKIAYTCKKQLIDANMYVKLINNDLFCDLMNLASWWRPPMKTFSALLAFCAGNSPVTCEFPAQRPVTRSFGVFFDLLLNQQLSKQWRRRWFETPLRSLWRHCNVITICPILLAWRHEEIRISEIVSAEFAPKIPGWPTR